MSGLLRTGLRNAAAAAVVAGLGTTGALVATAASARATNLRSTTATQSPFVGDWKGPVDDPHHQTKHYKVSMHIVTVSGHTVGSDTYSEGLSCGGKLTLITTGQSTLRVRETINKGPSFCITGGAITMKPTTNHCVDSWIWTKSGEGSAKGKVTRVGCK